MQTYFFHLRDGEDVLLDPEGQRFPSADAMKAAALHEGRDVIANDARAGRINFAQRLEIEDEKGAIVHRLALRDAVTVEGLTEPD